MRRLLIPAAVGFLLLFSSVAFAQNVRDTIVPTAAVPHVKTRAFLDRTHIGAVGEISFVNAPDVLPRLDIPRFEITIDHSFSDQWSLISETEIEHVKLTAGGGGEVAVEKLMLDYHASSCIGLRLGLLELPIGTLNQSHDPSSFLSVGRPQFDQRVIPTTWREIGAGIYGDLGAQFSYQFNVTEGIKATEFYWGSLEGIKQEGAGAGMGSDASRPAVSAKLAYHPMIGFDLGLSDYYEYSAGAFNTSARDQNFNLAAFDARYEVGNIHLLVEAAIAALGNADEQKALNEFGYVTNTSQGLKQVLGGYFEAGYNVLPFLISNSTSELFLFARAERFIFANGRYFDEFNSLQKGSTKPFTFVTPGLALKPLSDIILKADFQIDLETAGRLNQLEVGAGFSF